MFIQPDRWPAVPPKERQGVAFQRAGLAFSRFEPAQETWEEVGPFRGRISVYTFSGGYTVPLRNPISDSDPALSWPLAEPRRCSWQIASRCVETWSAGWISADTCLGLLRPRAEASQPPRNLISFTRSHRRDLAMTRLKVG